MSLILQAQKDVQQILSNTDEFGLSVELTPPSGAPVIFAGYHTKHHNGFDIDGREVNSKTAYIAVSELDLIAASYPYRNANSEVSMLEHAAKVVDSSGVVKDYIVLENLPDETLGIIVLILGD